MMSFEAARAVMLEGAKRLGPEEITLGEAAGRVLAEDIMAMRDQPPTRVSAMDGFAVGEVDAAVGVTLRLIGEAPAGSPFSGTIGRGETVRIATGGVVPDGADRIVIQENVEWDGDAVTIRARSEAGFVRPVGGDWSRGMVVARESEVITPARLGLLAALGLGWVTVARRPRVLILPSGDELREPGETPGPDAIFNSAAFAIAALVEQWGGTAVRHPILPDDRPALDACLAAADLACDVIVPLGGASVGDRDSLRPAFEQLGAAIIVDRVAVIPGKPTWFARFADGRRLVGLPGNPASAFVCAHLFLEPLMRALTGRSAALDVIAAVVATAIPPNGEREAFLRATATVVSTGSLSVTIDLRQDSSLQAPLAAANALVRRPPFATGALPGSVVECLLIGRLA